MRSVSFLFLVTAACSPYSPDLGVTPFLCADADPKCPDGYTCEAISMQNVCVKNGTTPPDAPDPNRICNNDMQVEMQNGANNDAIATAYQTPVAVSRKDMDFTGLAICPDGDLDYYSIQLTATQNIDVTLIYDTWGAVLQGEIENSGGGKLVQLSPMTGAERTMHAYINALNSGQYYVKIFGPNVPGMEGRNNYELKVVVTP